MWLYAFPAAGSTTPTRQPLRACMTVRLQWTSSSLCTGCALQQREGQGAALCSSRRGREQGVVNRQLSGAAALVGLAQVHWGLAQFALARRKVLGVALWSSAAPVWASSNQSHHPNCLPVAS